MTSRIYTDTDADLSLLDGTTVAVVGYGTQGTSRAMNMRDSGVNVIIGCDANHPEWDRAKDDGFEVV